MSRSALFLALLSGVAPGLAIAADGVVTIPLRQWQGMLSEIEAAEKPTTPTVAYSPIKRVIDGKFRKGLLRAELYTRFVVHDDRGHVRVPIVDGNVSLGTVTLGGARTSLLREGAMYTVGVDRPGTYELRAEIFWGQEQDRFTRRIELNLPPAGPTELSITIPEQDIEASLSHGALRSATSHGSGTHLVGFLDASGRIDLTWKRKLTHTKRTAAKYDTRINTLYTVGEAVVAGFATLDVELTEGETDRIDLQLPPGVEVLRVEGDAVLQWHTEAKQSNRLVILLRYLVDDTTRIAVHFQLPVVAPDTPVVLRMPTPLAPPVSGNIGIEAPAGLDVTVVETKAATELTLRDLPVELTELSSKPLLAGFSFEEAPELSLRIARHGEVELTSTIIDEMQASTVVIEDGTTITKLKLHVRNNTRQYLTARLPKGAVLTHALVDGVPTRPALATEGDSAGAEEVLLIPLRQSERLGAGGTRWHIVDWGETLGEIANYYYRNPAEWQTILNDNRQSLSSAYDLTVGQRLRIPARDTAIEESTFVIELAYELDGKPLGDLGHRRYVLPQLDVETMQVTWHLHFPTALMPLSFGGNVRQYSSIRYDMFRRVREFLRRASWMRYAWAGGGRYQSILGQRKQIYLEESQRKQAHRGVVSSFPLVGDRYRFKRILSHDEQPELSVAYVAQGVRQPVRWIGFLGALVFAFILLQQPRAPKRWLLAGGAGLILLVLGHYFLGVHRRILWGVDLALLATLLRMHWQPTVAWARSRVSQPWGLWDLLTFRNLLTAVGLLVFLWIVVAWPLLLSSAAFGLLTFLVVRTLRAQGSQEVRHA